MLKQALRSYWTSLHPRNFKETKNKSSFVFLYLYLLWMPFYFLISAEEYSFMAATSLLAKILPVLLILWSNMESKFMMTKIMYLCPMSHEERKEYVNLVLGIKIGIPVIFGMILESIWSCFYGFALWRFVFTFFIHISAGISSYICMGGNAAGDNAITMGKRGKDGTIKTAWMNVVAFAFSLALIVTGETNINSRMTTFDMIIVGLMVVMIVVFDILIVVTQYEDTIRHVENYEETHYIKGKVPANTNVKWDLFAKR